MLKQQLQTMSETLSQRGVTKKRVAIAFAGLVAGVVVTTVAADSLIQGGRGAAALAAAVHDPMSLFAQRSPGARGHGALSQTKIARLAPAFSERLGPPIIPAPEKIATTDIGSMPEETALTPVAEGLIAETPISFGAVAPTPLAGDIGTSAGPGASVSTPFLGGGGTSAHFASPNGPGGLPDIASAPPSSITEVAEPQAPVPETSVWVMMILGFFAVGRALRVQARRQATLSLGQA